MSETCAIEVYENQTFGRLQGWAAHGESPFSLKPSNIACKPLEEISLPNSDWAWVSNWKTSKMPGVTDADGWEYASKFTRFQNSNRPPKAEALWSRARRRLWIRVMRRDATIKSADLSKALAKVQQGLTNIHSARIRIEQVSAGQPEAIESEQMISLSNSVQRNIADLLGILDQAERLPPGKTDLSPAAVKKLKNEILKEEAAILRALERRQQPEAASSSSSSSSRKAGGGAAGRSSSQDLAANLQAQAQTVSSRGKGVSGGQGAFDPRIFSTPSSSGQGFDAQDGVFVERSMAEVMIDQKLVAVDEATVMQEIIDERHTEIKKVHKGLVELNEVFVEISKLVKEQEVTPYTHPCTPYAVHSLTVALLYPQIDMNQILGNADDSHVRTKEAYEHILEANRLHSQGNCVLS